MALKSTEKELHKESTIGTHKKNTKINQLQSINKKIMFNNIKPNLKNHLKNLPNYKSQTLPHKSNTSSIPTWPLLTIKKFTTTVSNKNKSNTSTPTITAKIMLNVTKNNPSPNPSPKTTPHQSSNTNCWYFHKENNQIKIKTKK